MYPFIRMIKSWRSAQSQPKLAIDAMHVSTHRCWPQDIDLWMELNNGRTLTLYDLGRIALTARIGLADLLRREKYGMTIAGSVVRYRRRIRPFEKFEMRSRGLFWDDKFIYLEQSIWKQNGECASHAVFRTAVTDKNGIVSPDKVIAALDHHEPSPEPAAWIKLWLEAEAQRPWPPMQENPTPHEIAA